ncbi:MAG: DUF2336 domain-containing protein, partial [Pseudomonadota bacterium]
IGALYVEHGETLSEDELEITADILRSLIRDVELPVRRALAEKLAQAPNAPRELVVFLANDAIEVAYPVLMRSTVLDEGDLIEIARLRTMQHRLAIAARDDVTAAVAEALAAPHAPRGEIDVLRTLLENPGAEIGSETMDFLVDQARTAEPLRAPMLSRRELDAGQAKRLYWVVSAALRRRILESFEIDAAELDEQLQDAVAGLIAEDADPTKTRDNSDEAIAQKLKADGTLNPMIMIQVLRQGRVPLFEAMFAEMVGLRRAIAQRVIYGEGGEALAVACRSLDIDKPSFASLFLLSRRARADQAGVDPMELSRALAVFDELNAERAAKMVKRWRLDPDFISAQMDIDAGAQRVFH